ncbi:MAG: hypothetical protein P3C09_14560 [Gemmatimonadota bacterium]|nr:hypothetical protein [Gemmatimonadota bacterium]
MTTDPHLVAIHEAGVDDGVEHGVEVFLEITRVVVVHPAGITEDRDIRFDERVALTHPQLGGGGRTRRRDFGELVDVGGIPRPLVVLRSAVFARNEVLSLLRAEAHIGLNNLATALADTNYICTTAGLLAAIAAFDSRNAAIDPLLYEQRYSLRWEGHRGLEATGCPLGVAQQRKRTARIAWMAVRAVRCVGCGRLVQYLQLSVSAPRGARARMRS